MARCCFACGKKTGTNPNIADTRDDQIVFVGMECYRRIVAAGDAGYQPERGGPRLWTIPKGLTQAEIHRIYTSAR